MFCKDALATVRSARLTAGPGAGCTQKTAPGTVAESVGKLDAIALAARLSSLTMSY